mmetsp:Transcript_64799/g.130170  ORF Transcript_64799/g.130170 Transcript_64799/m.130170 type:complete len:227 (+) Transcript_64799:116-796(+)
MYGLTLMLLLCPAWSTSCIEGDCDKEDVGLLMLKQNLTRSSRGLVMSGDFVVLESVQAKGAPLWALWDESNQTWPMCGPSSSAQWPQDAFTFFIERMGGGYRTPLMHMDAITIQNKYLFRQWTPYGYTYSYIAGYATRETGFWWDMNDGTLWWIGCMADDCAGGIPYGSTVYLRNYQLNLDLQCHDTGDKAWPDGHYPMRMSRSLCETTWGNGCPWESFVVKPANQ